jgi:glycosyltransferase involved in cell wall biosynthesis
VTVALDVGPLRAKPAGVGVYVRSLAQGLAEIGREDLVYIGRRADAEGLPAGVRSIARGGLPYPLWVELLGDRAVRASGASLAHFTDGLVPLLRSRPTVVTVLDLSLLRQWRTHRVVRYPRMPLVLAAPRLASAVIAISQATADEVMKLTRTPASRIHVVPLAARPSARPAGDAEAAEALARFGLARGAYVLVPGTLEPRKNHMRVIAAFEQLVRRSAIAPDMHLVLAGGRGWKAQGTLGAIEESPARERITWLGYVSEAEMSSLMTASAAVVYVSTYEGFGMPVLEAMACGTPVVARPDPALREVAGDAAVFAEGEDLAGAIRRALDDRDRLRAAGLERARQYSWDETARRTLAVYRDALR